MKSRNYSWIIIFLFLSVATATIIYIDSQNKQQALQSRIDTLQDELSIDNNILQLFFDNAYDRNLIELTEVTVSAYSSSRKETDDTPFVNASGGNTFVGQIAVSSDFINSGLQFGDTVYLDGLGLFKVQDVMAPRWKNKVDIWCGSQQAAKLFGVQYQITMLYMKR